MKAVRLLIAAGLVVSYLPAQQAKTVPTRVIANFGGPQDIIDDEMSRVQDVLRKPDGSFVVSNGRPIQVRYYSAKGNLIRRIGNVGDGPGEYQYTAYLKEWPGDSVLVFSSGGRRWILFGLDGEMVREWPASPQQPRPIRSWTFEGSAMLRLGTIGSGGCPRESLNRVAPRDEEVPSYAFIDGGSRIWLRRADSEVWTIHSPSGALLAQTKLPADLKITHFMGSTVTGVTSDDDGFPYVTAVEVDLPVAPKSSSAPCAYSSGSVSNIRAAQLKTAMRNSMTFSEAYFADHRTYPSSGRDMPSGFIPDDAEFRVLESSATGYIFMITDKETRYRCMVAVGAGEEGMFPDGVLLCGN